MKILILFLLLMTSSYASFVCTDPAPDPGWPDAQTRKAVKIRNNRYPRTWNFTRFEDKDDWVYQPFNGLPSQPKIQWLSSFKESTGLLKFEFHKADQGLKITLAQDNWFSSNSAYWYQLEVKGRAEASPSSQVQLLTYLYNGSIPNPNDFSGYGQLYSISSSFDLKTYLYSVGGESTMYAQISLQSLKAGRSNIYIDSVQIKQISAPVLMTVHFNGATFDTPQEASKYWVYEKPFGGMGLPRYSSQSGKLELFFSGDKFESIKMTMAQRPGITWTNFSKVGKLAGQQARVLYTGDNIDTFFQILCFGTDRPGSTEIKEISVYGQLDRFTPGKEQFMKTCFVASQPYFYGQILATNEQEAYLYLDQLFPLIEP